MVGYDTIYGRLKISRGVSMFFRRRPGIASEQRRVETRGSNGREVWKQLGGGGGLRYCQSRRGSRIDRYNQPATACEQSRATQTKSLDRNYGNHTTERGTSDFFGRNNSALGAKLLN